MIIVDTALAKRVAAGNPIKVAMVGAGYMARGIALQILSAMPGIQLCAISNRTLANAERAYRDADAEVSATVETVAQLDQAIRDQRYVITDDPMLLCQAGEIEAIIETTGDVELGARVAFEAIRNGKHIILMNAEVDASIGPILKVHADRAGVVYTYTDGDEPGVAMTLVRYVQSVGLKPVAAGNIKGMVDYYRTPGTQAKFAAQHDQDVRKVTSFADATKLSMETTVLANATGFGVARRGMVGPACGYVRDLARLLPPDAMLAGGIVDYSVGASPHTGGFVVVHEENPYKRTQLAYYKLGDGPFYVFYTPFHLPHIQLPSTIARAVIHSDPTVAPLAGPSCEVVTVAKRDLRAGERLDGVGGFCAYGLIDGHATARAMNALPIALSDDCVLLRDIAKDAVVSFDDVQMPPTRLSDTLWLEQQRRWPLPAGVARPAARTPQLTPSA